MNYGRAEAAAVAYLNVLPRNFAGGTEDKHEKTSVRISEARSTSSVCGLLCDYQHFGGKYRHLQGRMKDKTTRHPKPDDHHSTAVRTSALSVRETPTCSELGTAVGEVNA